MKQDKKLLHLVRKSIQASFTQTGDIDEDKIDLIIKTFQELSTKEAVLALKEYAKGLKREIAKSTLTIESSLKLNEQEIKNITKALKADFYILKVETVINPSLIGGVKLKIGDNIFDNSIVNRIDQLREELKN